MEFFNSAVGVLQTLVIALGAGLGIWGAINLLEGYGNDNPGANAPVRCRSTGAFFMASRRGYPFSGRARRSRNTPFSACSSNRPPRRAAMACILRQP